MERERKREELMVEKLKRSVLMRKKEGNSTPSPTWKFGVIQPDGTLQQDFNFHTNSKPLSARKLGANLWEMDKSGPILNHHNEDKLFEKTAQRHSEQPKSGINLGNQVAASMRQQKAQQPPSPASYCSSMEVAPHRPAITSSSSLGSKSKFGKSNHGLKTSTELLKVLNRILSLEEKHALDMSFVKTLRAELDQSHAQFKALLEEKKRDQKEIDRLTTRITEYKVAKKNENAVEEKLEAEVKLRRNFEKIHQKISQELLEMKKSFANALRELERERKARVLLEDLCDEFAKGIRDYEQELRSMKHSEGDDRLLLHISEAWLDERMQMNIMDGHDVSTILNKLSLEIEAFLRAKQSEKNDDKHSLETFHLNEPESAPWKRNDEDDSISVGKKKSKTRNLYGRKNPRRPKKGEIMQRCKRDEKLRISEDGVDLQGTRTRNPSLTKSSFDPSTFAGPPSPIKKWTSEVYPEMSGSCSRQGQSLKPRTLENRARGSKGLLQVD